MKRTFVIKSLFSLLMVSSIVACGSISNSSSSFFSSNSISQEVVIEFSNSQFDVDIAENDVLSLPVTISPSSATYEITSTSKEGFIVEGLNITFNKVGNYSFTLNASYDNYIPDSFVFMVYVYDTVTLSGDGSIENPYIVSTAEDLVKIEEAVFNLKDLTNKYFKQVNNISLSEFNNWEPIGSIGIPFEGIYDGNGFEITDLYIETMKSFQGVFGFSTGVIKNLTVRGEIYIENNPEYQYAHSYAGGIVGAINNNALVENCINYVNIDGDSYLGGVVGAVLRSDNQAVGYEVADIINCKNYGTITADDLAAIHEDGMYFGGIVGFNTGIVKGCENYGEVNIDGVKIRYVGGISGFESMTYKYGMDLNEDLTKYASTDNVNYGKVCGQNYVGGISGSNNLPLLRCNNYGEVEAYYIAGGISGVNGTSACYANNYSIPYLKDCNNYGKVTLNGVQYLGGITGYNRYDIINCINEGSVVSIDTNTNRVGGITGYHVDGLIDNCVNKGDVNGFKSIGGIVGYQQSDIINTKNEGNVNGYSTSYYVGGISGYMEYGSTKKCSNTGEISAKDHIGGIVGNVVQNSLLIEECINEGKVFVSLEEGQSLTSDNNFIGGIAGMLGSNNTINKCINKGDVIGYGSQTSGKWGGVAGIAGSIYANSKVLYSDNFGDIKGYYNVGGIVGYSQGGAASTAGNITNCSNKEGTIIEGTNSVGCIVGRNNFTYISNNSNYGTYIGTTNVGYICGRNNSSSYDDGTNVNYYKEATI